MDTMTRAGIRRVDMVMNKMGRSPAGRHMLSRGHPKRPLSAKGVMRGAGHQTLHDKSSQQGSHFRGGATRIP